MAHAFTTTVVPLPMPLLNDIPPAWACDEDGFCWWGEWSADLQRWDWRFASLQPENGFTHYLPHDVFILPARTAPLEVA